MTTDSALAADLYVRADAPVAARRDAIAERLVALERTGTIQAFGIHLWPDAVSLDARDPSAGPLETFRSAEAWADAHGTCVCPPFRVCTAPSELDPAQSERLVLPVLCLVIRDRGDVVAVYPSGDDRELTTIDDGLSRLENGGAAELVDVTQPVEP